MNFLCSVLFRFLIKQKHKTYILILTIINYFAQSLIKHDTVGLKDAYCSDLKFYSLYFNKDDTFLVFHAHSLNPLT